ncbi:MAG: hemerythrin domain-containing protein [Actinomycetota bacterium]|nr:hemerythrin domain-containing protein [Actinomycetota bacterium]
MVHRLVRRELRLLADLTAWAPDDEAERTATLTRHAELVGKVLLHHHAVERDAVWPALLRTVPEPPLDEVRSALDEWTARCARIDCMVRDVATAARQWAVAATPPSSGWPWRTRTPVTARGCSTACPPSPPRPGGATGNGGTGPPWCGCGEHPRRADRLGQ